MASFEKVAIDIIGPLPKSSNGNKYALVVVDYFSKWSMVNPLLNQRATTIAASLPTEVVNRQSVPLELHFDQGRSFKSAAFKELVQIIGIKKTRTTSLHPQSNGLVERLIRTLLQYLSLYIADNQKNLDQWIPLLLLEYRSYRHEITQNTSPAVLMGHELRLPLHLQRGPTPTTSRTRPLGKRLEEIHKLVRRRMHICSDRLKS